MRLGAENLGRSQLVDLGHALDFSQHNVVALLIRVALVLVNLNSSFFALLDEGHDELSGVLTVVIRDGMLLTVVEESDTESTGSGVEDIAGVVLSAELVETVRIAELAVEQDLGLADDVRRGISGSGLELIERQRGNLNVGVELAELLDTSVGSADLADVLLLKVEVGTEVLNFHHIGVTDLHGSGTGEDQVLGDLTTETSAADNDNVHFDELAHGLETEGSDLSRVEVGIDLHFLSGFHCMFVYERFACFRRTFL